jgi:hypothetical protein
MFPSEGVFSDTADLEGHLAVFVSDVVDTLDLPGLYRAWEAEDRGTRRTTRRG